MYAFVDVADYQKVVVSDAALGIDAAAKKYLGESATEYDANELITEEIVIKDITSAVIDSNTYYFFTDEKGNAYSASIKVDKNILPFVKTNQKYKLIIKNYYIFYNSFFISLINGEGFPLGISK